MDVDRKSHGSGEVIDRPVEIRKEAPSSCDTPWRGPITIRQNPVRFAWYHHQKDCAELRCDYRALRDMFVAEPKGFDNILATLAAFELRINRPK